MGHHTQLLFSLNVHLLLSCDMNNAKVVAHLMPCHQPAENSYDRRL